MADSGSRPRRTHRLRRWLIILLITPVILFSLYIWLSLTWSYSHGERAGYIQKFSQKGWVFRTWEGELAMVSMPGTTPEKFYFSVRNDSVASRINASLGQRVALAYDQHTGVPLNWWGETEYFVSGVRVIEAPVQP